MQISIRLSIQPQEFKWLEHLQQSTQILTGAMDIAEPTHLSGHPDINVIPRLAVLESQLGTKFLTFAHEVALHGFQKSFEFWDSNLKKPQ